MKSAFAIRAEDALSWHDASGPIAGIAERCGFHIRPSSWGWQVWATDADFADLCGQMIQRGGD